MLLPALAPLLLAQAALERAGPHFRILSHHPEARLADEALAVAEAAWPLALEAFALEDRPPAEPLVVHLHPDVAGYEAAEAELTRGAFRTSLAFSHLASRSAHVALDPPASAEVLRAFGLPTLTAFRIAREASRLASQALDSAAPALPAWFAQGSAEAVGHQALLVLERGAGRPEPLAEASAHACRRLLASGKLPDLAAVLALEPSGLGPAPEAAFGQELHRFLRAREPARLARVAAALRQAGSGSDGADRARAELARIWSRKELLKLQNGFAAFLAEPRQWDEVQPSLERRGEDYLQRAGSDAGARAFRSDSVVAPPATLHGTLHVLPGPGGQADLLLGRDGRGFLALSFVPGQGVTLSRCESGATETWTELGRGASAGLAAGTDVRFRVEIQAEELAAFVGDEEVLRVLLEKRRAAGPWGLGAQRGTTCLWKGVELSGPGRRKGKKPG